MIANSNAIKNTIRVFIVNKFSLTIAVVDFAKQVLGVKVKNPWRKDQNCSELVFRHVICVAYPEFSKKYDPDTISPRDIEDIVKNIGNLV